MKGAIPKPQADFVAAIRHGDMMYSTGLIPRRAGMTQGPGHNRPGDPADRLGRTAERAVTDLIAFPDGALSEGEAVGVPLILTV